MTNDNGESIECTCPRARIHDKKCVWYNPNYINIPDTRNDLSISEQAAQGKIYDMYQNTQNGQQESCGCGTAAEIAYLGHKSTCEEFQWIHERSSYEILLANLEKRKKVTLFENIKQNVMVCRGRGYNFYFLAPYGGRLFNSHMTYDISSCICDVTSGM